VLVLNLELCSLHFQETEGTGAGALVPGIRRRLRGEPGQRRTNRPGHRQLSRGEAFPETSHLITWRIGELGFDMHLSGEVPGRIGAL
jgi:predicted naringenin-chalcone synthase